MKIVIVGCGIVGAAIAYKLSQDTTLTITVLDRQPPAQASTGAALGVLMGAISQKAKGNTLAMRLSGIQHYDRWIPQLEATTGHSIGYNRRGILRLCFAGEDWEPWRSLQAIRAQQGWQLDLLTPQQLATAYPYLNLDRVIGAVYSPGDRQVDPTALTLALVAGAQQNGVTFHFNAEVTEVAATQSGRAICQIESAQSKSAHSIHTLHTTAGDFAADYLVIAAGLGSTPLTAQLQQLVNIRPVLGQAIQVQLNQPLDNSALPPVITGDDVHLVPLDSHQYWIGATVEFPDSSQAPQENLLDNFPLQPDAERLEQVRQQAIGLCPALETATILRQWHGLRPRPEARPAPIIEQLPGYKNVILASGHYRNGVLLAPATAEKVYDLLNAMI
jgi:glycine oxidase